MKKIIYLAVSVFSSSVAAGNFATCVLDLMPSSQNNAATYAVTQVCRQKYPDIYKGIAQGSGRGLFGYDSGAECTIKKAAETPNQNAGFAIRRACNCLYNLPVVDAYDKLMDNGTPSCEQQQQQR